IRLGENPTSGYLWDASWSPGLRELFSYYQEDEHPEGMVGVGGNRTWILWANNTRNQTFTAVLKQPWMPVTGNEPTYRLDFGILTFTSNDNGTTTEISPETRFAVQLRENPTTGYSWNASVSDGLEILSTYYRVDEHPKGMIGVGGNRTWILSAKGTGNQTFAAVNEPAWMPGTGNEYLLGIRILSQ
ncbi:MAG: protease inhibitor I42 family protein, partial [Methanoregula sp.]|nr:protease inhibitor I42 family protein [Methanoregula sp.]